MDQPTLATHRRHTVLFALACCIPALRGLYYELPRAAHGGVPFGGLGLHGLFYLPYVVVLVLAIGDAWRLGRTPEGSIVVPLRLAHRSTTLVAAIVAVCSLGLPYPPFSYASIPPVARALIPPGIQFLVVLAAGLAPRTALFVPAAGFVRRLPFVWPAAWLRPTRPFGPADSAELRSFRYRKGAGWRTVWELQVAGGANWRSPVALNSLLEEQVRAVGRPAVAD